MVHHSRIRSLYEPTDPSISTLKLAFDEVGLLIEYPCELALDIIEL
jgi:hypothetical protein